ncbi:TetR/AcrR family transcriptional regulator [Arthrobacter castelli]|uniref:TetR/AcrR family transcriptional regulator n=1 Tax=Arthrobacter castelli TaxID=271431 RepID=UPI000408EC40|nr:TetR/AcrR family transcriptional regulator [Arthrobacter castelli]
MPRVTDEYRAARRLEIAQAALRCFARKGFQATSMSDIIAESGLSAGAIYGHFKGKDDLISIVVGEVLEHHMTFVADMDDEGAMPEPAEVLARFVRGVEASFDDLGLLVQTWAEATTVPGLRQASTRAVAGLRGVFEDYAFAWITRPDAPAGSDPAARARQYGAVMLGICQGFIVQSVIDDDFDIETYIDGLAAVHLP